MPAQAKRRGVRRPQTQTQGAEPGQEVRRPRKRTTLRSTYSRGRYIIEPADDMYDGNGRLRTPVDRKGVMLEFEGHITTVDEDVMALVEECPSYTGVGAPKTIWIDGQPGGIPTREVPVRTTAGGIATGPKVLPPEPPLPNFDHLPGEDILVALAEGKTDPGRVIAWERSHRNRSLVLRGAAAALLAIVPEPAEPEPEPEPAEHDGPPRSDAELLAELPPGTGFEGQKATEEAAIAEHSGAEVIEAQPLIDLAPVPDEFGALGPVTHLPPEGGE